jgi:succinate dehydrogenase / fumarate reductase, membrane anchor subunit
MTQNSSSVRTASSKVSFLGAAKSGTGDLWLMRVTTIALVPLAIVFIWIVLRLVGKDQAGVRAEFAHPCTAIFMLLFILASIAHMRVGMQAILDDYIHMPRAKEWAMIGNTLFSIGFGLAAIFAVLKLSL